MGAKPTPPTEIVLERRESNRHLWFPRRPAYTHLGDEALAVLDDFAWTIYCLRQGSLLRDGTDAMFTDAWERPE